MLAVLPYMYKIAVLLSDAVVTLTPALESDQPDWYLGGIALLVILLSRKAKGGAGEGDRPVGKYTLEEYLPILPE